MKLVVILAAAFIANSASAHLKIGEYKGVDDSGNPCAFEVKAVHFEGGIQHPLNERATVLVAGAEFALQHLPSVDFNSGTVAWDHDHLTGTQGFPGGGIAVVLKMEHTEAAEGPSELHYVKNDRTNPVNNFKNRCLKLIAP